MRASRRLGQSASVRVGDTRSAATIATPRRLLGAGLIAAFTCIAATAHPAAAVDLYHASGYVRAYYPGSPSVNVYYEPYDVAGYLSTGDEARYDNVGDLRPDTSVHIQANSLGGPGFLRAHAYAQLLDVNPDTFSPAELDLDAQSTIENVYTDLVITGPAGTAGTSISVPFNLFLAGGFIIGTNLTDYFTSAASYVSISVRSGNTDLTGGTATSSSILGNAPVLATTGALAAFNGAMPIQTPALTVTVGQPFSLELDLTAGAGVSGAINRSANLFANADFGDTFSFATDGPVAVLPAGYTLNSAEANIIDNAYTLPEPATGMLLLSLPLVYISRRPTWRPIVPDAR